MIRAALPALVTALGLLAACGEETEAPATGSVAPVPAPTPPVARPVRAEIFLGSFESKVSDLAAWEVRPFGFQSLVFAANGEEGIAAIRADGGTADIIAAEAPAVFLATRPLADGSGLLYTLAADGSLEARRVGGDFPVAETLDPVPSPRDLCVNAEGDVAAVGAEGLVAVAGEIDLQADGLAGAIACAGVGEDFYVLTATDGWVLVTGSGIQPTPLPDTASVLVAAGEEVFALRPDGASASLFVNDEPVALETVDDQPLRPLMVAPAYGNFGGVMRDGALVILDEERGLHLVAWSAVASALGLPPVLESRLPAASPADVEFSVPGGNEEFGLRTPGFEEREPPAPPGPDL